VNVFRSEHPLAVVPCVCLVGRFFGGLCTLLIGNPIDSREKFHSIGSLESFDKVNYPVEALPCGEVSLKEGLGTFGGATAVGQNKKVRAAGAGGYIFGIDYLRLKK